MKKKIVILNDTSHDLHHGCDTVMSNINVLAKKYNLDIIYRQPVGCNWEENEEIYPFLDECDLILVNGEGTFHHSQERALHLSKIVPYAKKLLNKPKLALINATYQDNSKEINDNVRGFDFISVRETLSQKDLLKSGIESVVVPDLSFYTPFDLSSKIVVPDSVGFTDSVDSKKSYSLYCQFNLLKPNSLFLPIIRKNHDRSIFMKIKRKLKLWYTMLVGKPDYLLWDLCYEKHYFKTYEEYILKISSLESIVLGRYHSLCFAVKTKTPFIVLDSNSHKIKGILSDIGISGRQFSDIESHSVKDFADLELKRIDAYVDKAPYRIEQFFKKIVDSL